jgi:catechol 2,3-dioxygenase
MGHVHLRVASIPETNAFYRDLLGFDLMASMGQQATFLSAGGYHHHIGANTWETAGRPPAPETTARLERMTILLPSAEELDRVAGRAGGTELRDPSGNPVALQLA